MKSVVAFCALLCGAWSLPLLAQEVPGCGNLQNGYGPYDYTDPVARRDKLPIVESYHFTSQVESLVRGQSGDIVADIDYTLRAFPNHHRALATISRYVLNGGNAWTNPSIQSADCYFLRAVAFAPNDAATRLLFGNYLFKRGERQEARDQYEEAISLAPDSPDISYNAGLFYLDIGDIARAGELARIAYDKGYPLPGLKNRLEAARSASADKKQ